MTVYAVSADLWKYSEEADRRFRRTLIALIVPVLILSLIVPFLKIAGLERGGGDAGTSQYVEILDEPAALDEVAEEPEPAEQDEPEPTPEVEEPVEEQTTEPVAEPVPEPTPEPEVIDRTAEARERAQQTGILAMQDQLQDLRAPSIAGLDANQQLAQSTNERSNSSGGESGSVSSEQLASSAARSSGGVAATQVQRRQSGTGLGTRRTTTVEKPKGFGEDRSRIGQGGDDLVPGRTIEEIQLVFDRNKSAFYAIYNRSLRKNPSISGKLNVSLTIAPSGKVTNVEIVNSTLGNRSLEQKILARIRLINFGAKDVPEQTFPSYPLHFYPVN